MDVASQKTSFQAQATAEIQFAMRVERPLGLDSDHYSFQHLMQIIEIETGPLEVKRPPVLGISIVAQIVDTNYCMAPRATWDGISLPAWEE